MSYPVCPCDGALPAPPVNLPALPYISYRVGTYASFRQAVLTPLLTPATPLPLAVEQSLSVDGVPVWTTDGAGDLAVMIAEWFAYIADVIAFYNERIANQDYLRTADLPESVTHLIALLGYRPRPAIGAYGTLAALVSPGPSFGGQPVLLPQGLQIQSKPTPGLTPQIFELQAATPQGTPIGGPDQFPCVPAPSLFDGAGGLLLQGAITSIAAGDRLMLSAIDGTAGGPWLAAVTGSAITPAPAGGGQQTSLSLTWSPTPPASLNADRARLARPGQSSLLWSFYSAYDAIDGSGTDVQLASLVRQITPGDVVLVSGAATSAPPPVLAQVQATTDLLWDANAGGPPASANAPLASVTTNTKSGSTTVDPLPMPHTQLTMAEATLLTGWSGVAGVSVQFGWVSAGSLLNQPSGPWSGDPDTLTGTGGQVFPPWNSQPVLLQDATGIGIAALASDAGANKVTLTGLPDPLPTLQPPFLVLPNLLAVNCGKTVANEVLGSGDATRPGQDFQLARSPVTYLENGAICASTISLTVNGLPWTEVAFFFGQTPDATVFVTREDDQGNTHAMFGDGVNGARLPTGVNNVVATYRIGSGADMPPAGKLSVIAQSFPGLRSVLNPVAVIGGADADQPSRIVHDAPRSVLCFGRAVSVFDYQALAGQVPSVTRAQAVWGWSATRNRTMVIVYVGDTPGAVTAARTALKAVGDPNRPVQVTAAKLIAVRLHLDVIVTPGMDRNLIGSAIGTVLTDAQAGLFGAGMLEIGQTVFDSRIESAVLSVAGVVAVTGLWFLAGDIWQRGALHLPGEGGVFTLAAGDLSLTMEPDPNG